MLVNTGASIVDSSVRIFGGNRQVLHLPNTPEGHQKKQLYRDRQRQMHIPAMPCYRSAESSYRDPMSGKEFRNVYSILA